MHKNQEAKQPPSSSYFAPNISTIVCVLGLILFSVLSLVFCNSPALLLGIESRALLLLGKVLCHWAKPSAIFSLLTSDSYHAPLFMPDWRKSSFIAVINSMSSTSYFHPANFFFFFLHFCGFQVDDYVKYTRHPLWALLTPSLLGSLRDYLL